MLIKYLLLKVIGKSFMNVFLINYQFVIFEIIQEEDTSRIPNDYWEFWYHKSSDQLNDCDLSVYWVSFDGMTIAWKTIDIEIYEQLITSTFVLRNNLVSIWRLDYSYDYHIISQIKWHFISSFTRVLFFVFHY